MSSVKLVPLGLGELLDHTFSYFRKHFLLFVGIMALPQVVIIGFNILIQIFQNMAARPINPNNPQAAAQMATLVTRTILMAIAVLLVYYLVYATALGATTYALSEIHLGRSTTIRRSYRIVRQKLGRLLRVFLSIFLRTVGLSFLAFFGLAFLVGMAMAPFAKSAGSWVAVLAGLVFILGAVACAILVFIFVLRYGVAVPALLLEDLSPRQALKRSVALTKGFLGRLFVVLSLMMLISFVVSLLFQSPFTVAAMLAAIRGGRPSLWLSIPGVVAGGLGHALTAPLLVIGFALVYYDLRVRKEGFDLQLMMSDLDQSRRAPGAVAPMPVGGGERLEETSVLEMLLWTVLTGAIYQPVWFMIRRKALNNLRSTEKLSGLPLAVALGGVLVVLFLLIAGSFHWGSWIQAENALGPVHPLLTVAVGAITVVQCFKVRRILLDHLRPQATGLFSSSIALQDDTAFSNVATFFFGIFYLQYKINELLPLLTREESGPATPGLEPAPASPLPPINS